MEKTFFERHGIYKHLFYVVPLTAFWFVFNLLPNVQLFYVAFLNWNGVSREKMFVGLQNFRDVLSDSGFSKVVINTLLYVLFLLILQTGISLILAFALRKNTKKNILFRALFFTPIVLSSAVVGLTWGFMYDTNLGMINTFLKAIGLKNLQQDWLGVAVLSVFCVVVVNIWQGIGIPVIMLLSGLTGVPQSLDEAASIDGANRVQLFFHITMPLLAPTLARVLLLTMIGGGMAFDYVYILGGSANPQYSQPFDTIAVYMYKNLSIGRNIGIPSSISVFLSLTMLGVFIVQFFVTRRLEENIQ